MVDKISTTKVDLLRSIETERDWWRAMLGPAIQDGPLTGNEAIDGNWSLKGLLAHIDGWRQWTLTRLQAAASGTIAPVPPWPAEMSEAIIDGVDGVDEINAWFTEQADSKDLDEVIDDLYRHLDGMHAVIEQMSPDDLFTPGRYSWLGHGFESIPIGPALLGSSISHVHEEHAPALEAWLRARLGQQPELPPVPSNFGYGS